MLGCFFTCVYHLVSHGPTCYIICRGTCSFQYGSSLWGDGAELVMFKLFLKDIHYRLMFNVGVWKLNEIDTFDSMIP